MQTELAEADSVRQRELLELKQQEERTAAVETQSATELKAQLERLEQQQADEHAHHQAVLDTLRSAGLQKVVLRMQRRGLVMSWRTWSIVTQKSKKLKASAVRVLGRLQHVAAMRGHGADQRLVPGHQPAAVASWLSLVLQRAARLIGRGLAA